MLREPLDFADLDTAHLRLLAQLARNRPKGPQEVITPTDRALIVVLARHGLVEDDTIERQAEALKSLAEHLVAQNRLSVISPRDVARRGPVVGDPMAGFTPPDIDPRWTIKLLGEMCLDYLPTHESDAHSERADG